MGEGGGVTSGSSYRHQRQGRLDGVRAVASAMWASTSPHLISPHLISSYYTLLSQYNGNRRCLNACETHSTAFTWIQLQ